MVLLEQIGEGWKVKTGVREEALSRGINAGDHRLLPTVAAPRVDELAAGVIRRVPGSRGNRDEVIGEARPHDGREEVVVQGKGTRILPVVRDVRLVELGVGYVLSVLDGAGEEIKAVHLSVVDGEDGGGSGVTNIQEWLLRRTAQGNALACGQPRPGCSVSAGKQSEHRVKRSVLFVDDDDVFDRINGGGSLHGMNGGICRRGFSGAKKRDERRAGGHAEEQTIP